MVSNEEIWAKLLEIETLLRHPPAPTREVMEWSASRVNRYKNIEDLLRDMKHDGFDLSKILLYGEQEKTAGRRLTTAKVADKFFRKSAKANIVAEKAVDIVPERRKFKNDDFIKVFERMKAAGWDEDKFKKTEYRHTFKGLLDFCGYAPDHIIDKCSSTSQK